MKKFFVLSIVFFFFNFSIGENLVGFDSLLNLSNNWLSLSGSDFDFDLDGVVFFEDLLIFLDYWLYDHPYYGIIFDLEDFSQFSRNFGRVINPLNMDLNSDGITNLEDFWILALLWEDYNIDFYVRDPLTGENKGYDNLSGLICLVLQDVPYWADEVYVYVNDFLVDRWNRLTDSEPIIFIDTTEFKNGQNRVTLLSRYGGINFPSTKTLFFRNIVSSFLSDEDFDSNSSFNFSGEASTPVIVSIKDVDDQVIWSQFCLQGSFSFSISPEVFGQNLLCSMTISSSDNGQDWPVFEKDFTKKFKVEDNISYQMVIISPYHSISLARWDAIKECILACKSRGVSWVPLYGRNVVWKNLEFLLPRANYVYWVGHSNSVVYTEQGGAVYRTFLMMWEENWWYLVFWQPYRFIMKPVPLFSYTKKTNPNAEPLPGDLDQKGYDMTSLGMYDSNNKKIVVMDSCSSGFLRDMAWSFGIFYYINGVFVPKQNQVYLGWKIPIITSNNPSFDALFGNTGLGMKIFWKKLGEGRSVYDSLFAVFRDGGIGAQEGFFGLNGIMEIGDPNGDDNIVVYGQGINLKLGN